MKIKYDLCFIMAIIYVVSVGILAYLYIKKKNNYVSHSYEPRVGDLVENNNKQCKHYKSCGEVMDIKALDGDMGKVIVYKVSNNGNTYKEDDVLVKTMDQLIQML